MSLKPGGEFDQRIPPTGRVYPEWMFDRNERELEAAGWRCVDIDIGSEPRDPSNEFLQAMVEAAARKRLRDAGA